MSFVSNLHGLASPARFLRLADRVQPWTGWAAALLIGAGLVVGLGFSPPDYQQGETVRIMYIHVPSAWMALFCYATMALAAAAGLIWRHPLAHVIAHGAAPIGACFTIVCLATGMLWGKPIWGRWWVWDARLTSVLILLFLYLGYIALANAFDNTTRGDRSSAILALVGAVNLPVIKFSVDWWNTLHQPASVTRIGAPAVHESMLAPLLLMAAGFLCLFLTLLFVRVRAGLLARRLRALRHARAHVPTVGGMDTGTGLP
ncbi:MAG: heme ABC transporter permease [Defluviicoccus sp.]|nr:heme ABC transporter permease [Defluviicoccus sp.]MDE0384681.1 heme ABC transporter permease [Defluviicoccus sp.]